MLWALAPRLRHVKGRLIAKMASSTYERWRIGHRLTGLFVAIAIVHAALVDPVLHESNTLLAAVLLAGGVGVAAYLYRELLAKRVTPVYHYVVQDANHLSQDTLEVVLATQRQACRLRRRSIHPARPWGAGTVCLPPVHGGQRPR